MEAAIIETADQLARFRKQVRDEDETRPKMSEAAKAKLRSINERDRLNAEADARLVKEFASRPVTLERLADLFAKSFGGTQQTPRRRAIKAMYRLAQGRRVYHIYDISLFGELSSGEAEMPMNRFLAKYPLPEDETVTPAGEPIKPVKQTEVVPCASGVKCLWVKRGKAAPAVGRSKYCTPTCQKSDAARQRRQNMTSPAQNPAEALAAPA